MHFHLLLLEGQQVFQLHELQLVRLFTVLHLDLSQLQHLLVVSFQPSEPVSHQLVVLHLSVVQTHLLVYYLGYTPFVLYRSRHQVAHHDKYQIAYLLLHDI